MKKNLRRIAAAIAATALCVTAMTGALNISAAAYYYPDYNQDNAINSDDYYLMKKYISARQSNAADTIARIERQNPSVKDAYRDVDKNGKPDGDYNRDGVMDRYDAEYIRWTYTLHPEFTYDEAARFYQAYGGSQKLFVSGDANGDLEFDWNDARALRWYLNGGSDRPRALFNRSNMNSDKVLDHKDLEIMIKRLSNKLAWDDNGDRKADSKDRESIYNYLISHLSELDRLADVKRGDANGDGKVDMTDVIVIQQYLIDPVKYPTAGRHLDNANVFGSFEYPSIDIGDLTGVQMIVSGYKTDDGRVNLDAKMTVKGKSVYVFGYYDDLNAAQAKREGWKTQYIVK